MADYYEPTPASDLQEIENRVVNTALTKMPTPYLTGLKLKEDIVLNGLTFNTIDENNVVWIVSDIDGWWTLPENEIPDLPRGWGDGSYDAIGRWANRVITISGTFLTQYPEDAPAARATLMNALNLVKTGGWLVVYEDKTDENPNVNGKSAYVRLSGSPQITSTNARGRHDFTIGLKAVDPIKYEYVDGQADGYRSSLVTVDTEILDEGSPTGYYGGSTIINNEGTIAVPIIIEMPFGLTIPDANALPYIENSTTDQRITFNTGTESDRRLELDTYNREVLDVRYQLIAGAIDPNKTDPLNVLNGRANMNVIAGWIYLNPGSNDIFAGNFAQSTEITILYKSGWIG
tara:strand:- start:5620 stop:6657 length:1038 start_codon:yes stop_codon:yes gene_type:complete